MIDTVRRLVARMFPELLAGYHLPVFAVVESIADSPAEGGLADPYRPRWAVNLQLLDEHGRPDRQQPLLEAVPVTVPGAGQERGLFALPQPGAVVEVAWAYGRPDQPFVRSVLPTRQSLPACDSAEQVWQQRAGVAQKVDKEGDWTRTTPATITDQSESHIIKTLEKIDQLQNEVREILEHSVEQVDGIKLIEAGTLKLLAETAAHLGSGGSLNTTAASDQNQVAGAAINQVSGGDINQDVGADLIQDVAGKVAQTVADTITQVAGGDISQQSDGNISSTAGGNITHTATGPLVMKGASVWIGSPTTNVLALVSSFMGEVQAALTTLSTHTHPSVGQITEGGSVATNATNVGSTKSTLDGLQP